MHPTAIINCKRFFDAYAGSFSGTTDTLVLDIGAQDVNGSLRSVLPKGFNYIGVDFVAGKNVDVVLTDPYILPFDNDSADIILSSSCFEHSEMFWLSYLEILRVLKPRGLFYLNVPSNGDFHRYPVDCWRFYPDSGGALSAWARRSGYDTLLLESYVSGQHKDIWNDFVAVFLKCEKFLQDFPIRILGSKPDIYNGVIYGEAGFKEYSQSPEDRLKLKVISSILNGDLKIK
jgi:SAM-dependent methyltransferase